MRLEVATPPSPEQPIRALVRETIYFVLLEAPRNVEQHSHRVLLRVEDSGVGFNPEHERSGSYGVIGMRERAQASGGTFEISRGPRTGGACVELRLPEKPT